MIFPTRELREEDKKIINQYIEKFHKSISEVDEALHRKTPHRGLASACYANARGTYGDVQSYVFHQYLMRHYSSVLNNLQQTLRDSSQRIIAHTPQKKARKQRKIRRKIK